MIAPAAVAAVAAALSAFSAPNVADQTLLCSTAADNRNVLRLDMTAAKRTGADPAAPALAISAGSVLSQESLVFLTSWAGFRGSHSSGVVSYRRGRCRPSSKSVALTSTGLPRPAVPFDQMLRCPVGAHVLVRLRAALDRRTVWRVQGNMLAAAGDASSASISVRTEVGKPLAFFRLDSGKTRLWTARRCT